MKSRKFPLIALLIGAGLTIAFLVWLETGASNSVFPKGTDRKQFADNFDASSEDLAKSTVGSGAKTTAAAVSAGALPSGASTSAQGSVPGTPTVAAVSLTNASVSGGVRPVASAVAAQVAPPVLSRSGGRPAKGALTYRSTAQILEGKDLADPRQRAVAVAEMEEAEKIRYDAVLAEAKALGIPVRIEGPGHKVSILHDIGPEGPVYRTTMNANAASQTPTLMPVPLRL